MIKPLVGLRESFQDQGYAALIVHAGPTHEILGDLLICVDNKAQLKEISFIADEYDKRRAELFFSVCPSHEQTERLSRCAQELQAYLGGSKEAIFIADHELESLGTAFQVQVWKALRLLPYAETISYSALAAEIGRPRAARAVANAARANSLLIAVPCHRLVAKDSIGGFWCGLHYKRHLMDFEGIDLSLFA